MMSELEVYAGDQRGREGAAVRNVTTEMKA